MRSPIFSDLCESSFAVLIGPLGQQLAFIDQKTAGTVVHRGCDKTIAGQLLRIKGIRRAWHTSAGRDHYQRKLRSAVDKPRLVPRAGTERVPCVENTCRLIEEFLRAKLSERPTVRHVLDQFVFRSWLRRIPEL